jgi:CheY-like chemotaxis protein
MNAPANAVRILVAEDDADDRLLIRNAFEASGMPGKLCFVNDGEELLDYLYRRGKYAKGGSTDQPGIILLDLNMPKVDGREALKVIKNDDALKRIPIVVLTTSNAEIDVVRSYDLGVNSFITKPVTFDGLIKVVETLSKYWFDVVKLPTT